MAGIGEQQIEEHYMTDEQVEDGQNNITEEHQLPPTPIPLTGIPIPVPDKEPGILVALYAAMMIYWILNIFLLIEEFSSYTGPANLCEQILTIVIFCAILPIYFGLQRRAEMAWIFGLFTVALSHLVNIIGFLSPMPKQYTDSMDDYMFYTGTFFTSLFHGFFLLIILIVMLLPSVRRWFFPR